MIMKAYIWDHGHANSADVVSISMTHNDLNSNYIANVLIVCIPLNLAGHYQQAKSSVMGSCSELSIRS